MKYLIIGYKVDTTEREIYGGLLEWGSPVE